MQVHVIHESDKLYPSDTDTHATASSGLLADSHERVTRRRLRGTVISDRMQKTITVRVERVFKHAKYKKYIRRHKNYHAHDEESTARMGDQVEIEQCRPLSKIKRWRLISVLQRADLVEGGAL